MLRFGVTVTWIDTDDEEDFFEKAAQSIKLETKVQDLKDYFISL